MYYDIIIVGAGVVGSLIARELSRYELSILLLDKEADVGMGVSSANTALIHAGYDPIPGTLKASLNVSGNKRWDNLSEELGFSFARIGDYVVAIGDEEFTQLDELLKRGKDNGVRGMKIISGEEMKSIEPRINSEVRGALWAPSTGICDPFGVVVASAENAVMNGVSLSLETSFEDFIIEGKKIVGIKTNRGCFGCRWVINSAGLRSDEVMHKAGIRPEFTITPRKGEYLILDKAEITLDKILFPLPTKDSKGILVTTTVHGNVMIGPNAQISTSKEDTSTTEEGLKEIFQGALKLIPGLSVKQVISSFAGIRPTGNARCSNPLVNYGSDFLIEIPQEVKGLVNLAGIDSPGLTSAPAIALRVIDLLKDAGEKLVEKKNWNPIRKSRPRFRDLSMEQRKELINKNALYGRIVCRCELITEGEIVAEINSPLPVRTYDALKRRTWLGTGRCQGGFDTPRVVEILSRELKFPPEMVTKKGSNSNFLFRPTKERDDGCK